MDRAHRRPRHRVLAVTLATLLVPLLVGSASAASSKPVVNVSAGTPSGATVSVIVTVNRGLKQIASCRYGVDAPATIDCTNAGGGSKSTAYTIALSGQAVGDHTITVTVRLTDGGTGSGSDTFTIAPPRVLARAWTNVDEVAGYDPDADLLISELVDTDRSNTVSIGDTVRAYAYPTNFAGTPPLLPFGDSTHTVDHVHLLDPTVIRVSSGEAQFGWVDGAFLERYVELFLGSVDYDTDFVDQLVPVNGNCGDRIKVLTSAPSQAAENFLLTDFTAGACGDRPFVDVAITLTP